MGWQQEVEAQDRTIRSALQQRHVPPKPGEPYRFLSVSTLQRLEHRRDYARVSEFVSAWVDRPSDPGTM